MPSFTCSSANPSSFLSVAIDQNATKVGEILPSCQEEKEYIIKHYVITIIYSNLGNAETTVVGYAPSILYKPFYTTKENY